jgi:hypothetical protein
MSGETGATKAQCHKCTNVAEDNCAVCGKNTCKVHGKYIAEGKFVCRDHIDAMDS